MKTGVLLAAAAIVVVILASLALREEPLDTATPAPRQPAATTPAAPEPVVRDTQPVLTPGTRPAAPAPAPPGIEIVDDTELMAALAEFGFAKLDSKWREWARTRGYPVTDETGQQYYDQPYEQYDDVTLKGLADNGDMWAAQILAGRIATTNPAEAIELYRKAAVQGSVYAMNEMANLYGRVASKRREADFKSDELALEQVYAMRDAPVTPEVAGYAWTVVAGLAGSEPMFGDINASQFEKNLSEQQIEEACSLADGLFDDLRSQRDAQGKGGFDRTPPPMVYADPSREARCGHDMAAGLDLSGCRQLEVQTEQSAAKVWLCGEDNS